METLSAIISKLDNECYLLVIAVLLFSAYLVKIGFNNAQKSILLIESIIKEAKK
ncbi:hypothetical protein [uncultured Gammaproteobacteria bacterium]|jgi:hypothetical protein|nr:hypothetical protein BROOK1789B_1818 [Bathymodiolus brooksi thiotrophic gill symbiont]CAC9561671.1 hypothetical protein [uncultured Gammaproteobacteria bacterium]CAC9565465.1 hypothetical protein [uncultured Gammaproteobacteria bacterium]CAC9571428.1 hypothetical protein [uncultured Gammaproteobacteria bacterium]CAC9571978.1 hypothetical protein [uncultured Gammaproteobacteria bacterium]